MANFFDFVYIDRTGKEVFRPTDWVWAGDFSDGLAVTASGNGLFGYIDKSNNVVIGHSFYGASPFNGDVAVVKLPRTSGFLSDDLEERGYFVDKSPKGLIDRTGKLLFVSDFEKLFDFSEGISIGVGRYQSFFVDRTGVTLQAFDRPRIEFAVCENQRFSEGLVGAYDVQAKLCGFVDRDGRFVIDAKFEDVGTFSDGLARVTVISNHRLMLGFINRTGEFVIPPKFDIDHNFRRNAGEFSEGLAAIMHFHPEKENNEGFDFIDKSGEIVLRTNFSFAGPFCEGLVVVLDDETGKFGYIDNTGRFVIPPMFSHARDFSDGLALVCY